ncbi:MATE family efflux transporter [Mesomycoplasma ovipneumoniae]|uniref:Probable multidrug resistance protein NorM n=1 Tax=Mesomycoplasma ovipneumoniae 14811 TaxID=1188239 RepID=A0A014M241_9BACT|nr:MATE family efflux transporter [Mesomycoplasma ovipneumoniae]EXU61028.1 Hypothetical protein, predicted transmembrane protein, putative MatE family efflux protein [Mesomycoplasma ovipneumoniae 14811]
MHFSIKKFFPDSPEMWKKFAKITIPVILATLFISINNFIDNFMVSQISGGITAVGMANFWTGIVFSFIISINTIGSIIFAQYWGKKEFKLAQQVNNIRYILSFIVILFFAVLSWAFPESLLRVVQWRRGSSGLDQSIFDQAKSYLFIISFSWILFAYIVTSSGILREIGVMKVSVLFNTLTLVTNIGLNFLLIPLMGVAGSALATVISRLITSFLMYLYQLFYRKEISLSVLKMFQIERQIWKQFFARFVGMSLVTIASLIISVRSVLWSQSLPPGSIGIDDGSGFYKFWGIGFLTISGIILTIANIFFTTFASIQTSVSIVVGQNLGQNKIELAKKNAAMLKGFLFVVSVVMSVVAFIIVFVITKTDLITTGIQEQVQKGLSDYFNENNLPVDQSIIDAQKVLAVDFYLNQIFIICIVIILINPIWVQINASLTIIKAGGRANFASWWDFFTGIGQLVWQILIVLVFIPLISEVHLKLFISLTVFYLSDILKWIIFELIYLKSNWAINLTLENSALKESI